MIMDTKRQQLNESKLTAIARQRNSLEYRRFSSQSIAWFRNKISNFKNKERIRAGIIGEKSRLRSPIQLGSIYFFVYDPKHKQTLPYYDTFPMVLVLKDIPEHGGFLGLNFHYLPTELRIKLMAALDDNFGTHNKDNTQVNKIKVSKLVDAIALHPIMKPCLKMYLYAHVHSRFAKVLPDEYEAAAFMPVHNFQKASYTQVWSDSRKIIKDKTKKSMEVYTPPK
jgi:hypothetical protein